MKNVELKNETFQDFMERCNWYKRNEGYSSYTQNYCTKGLQCESRFVCAECYCPRLKHKEIETEANKIIL